MGSVATCAQLTLLISVAFATPIDNNVVSSSVQCSHDAITLTFNTKNSFQGRIYVKGMSDKPECSKSFTDSSQALTSSPSITFSFGGCNMQRSRTLSPQPGMMQSIVTVISFHKLFITKVDKAYKVQCFYMEAANVVTSQLEVSMITTEEVRDTGQMPTCTYQVRRSRTGPIVRYAKVGEAVYHEWECDSTSHKILVKSCFVDDGQGTRYQILDDQGCNIDKYILPEINYEAATPAKAWVESHVFKYADKSTVFFQCVIQLCNKGETTCEDITPPKCPGGGAKTNVSKSGGTSAVERVADIPEPPKFAAGRRGNGKRSIALLKNRGPPMQKGSMGTMDHSEVDLLSEPITVIELDEGPTLKNGENSLDKEPSIEQSLSSNEQVESDSKIVCMSPIGFGALISFVLLVFMFATVVSLFMCKFSLQLKAVNNKKT